MLRSVNLKKSKKGLTLKNLRYRVHDLFLMPLFFYINKEPMERANPVPHCILKTVQQRMQPADFQSTPWQSTAGRASMGLNYLRTNSYPHLLPVPVTCWCYIRLMLFFPQPPASPDAAAPRGQIEIAAGFDSANSHSAIIGDECFLLSFIFDHDRGISTFYRISFYFISVRKTRKMRKDYNKLIKKHLLRTANVFFQKLWVQSRIKISRYIYKQ